MTTLRTQINKRHMRIWRRNCLRIFFKSRRNRCHSISVFSLASDGIIFIYKKCCANQVKIVYLLLTLKFKHVTRIILQVVVLCVRVFKVY